MPRHFFVIVIALVCATHLNGWVEAADRLVTES